MGTRLIIVMLMLLVGGTPVLGACGGDGPESKGTEWLLAELKARGGEVTVKDRTLTAEIGDDKYKTTIPEGFDAFEYFEDATARVTIHYKKAGVGWLWVAVSIGGLALLIVGMGLGYVLGRGRSNPSSTAN